MKRFQSFMVCLICGVILVTITGCGNKTALTSNDFKTMMESKGYIVKDGTSQFAQYNYYKHVYFATDSSDNYDIEFYELSTDSYAINLFNNLKSALENSKASASGETSVNIGNHSKYALTTAGKFKVVSRIDNTLIYLEVDDDYKASVKDILKYLGY